jgi:hypothetical protein
MTSLKQWTIGALIVAAFLFPIVLLSLSKDAGWGIPRATLTGKIFDPSRALIIGGALDQPSLHKEFFLFAYSTVVVGLPLAFLRIVHRGGAPVLRRGVSLASLALLFHPASILALFTYDLGRYIYRMGTTSPRLWGLLVASLCWVALSGFALWVCYLRRKTLTGDPGCGINRQGAGVRS